MLRAFPCLLLVSAVALGACGRLGDLGDGAHGVLAQDARQLPAGDPAGPGPDAVIAKGVHVGDWEDGFTAALYQPAGVHGPLPAVVFLPARGAPEWLYDSYARALASRGMVVAMRRWYGFFKTDPELAAEARTLASWLVKKGLAQPDRIGVAGHSMGGKSSLLAALDASEIEGAPPFHAVVAIDPDENGYRHVARGPIAELKVPLLVVGADVATKAFRMCATKAGSFRSFFKNAPPGTIELTLRDADHVQVTDNPDMIGMGICRVGTADSKTVRLLARAATVTFFERHLLGKTSAELPRAAGVLMRVKAGAEALTRAATR